MIKIDWRQAKTTNYGDTSFIEDYVEEVTSSLTTNLMTQDLHF